MKHNKTWIGVSLKNSTIPLLQSRDLEFSKGLTLMSETCLFLWKPSLVKLPSEIILWNEPLGTLRSHSLHRDFFFFFFKFNSFGVSSSPEPAMSFQIICCSRLWKGCLYSMHSIWGAGDTSRMLPLLLLLDLGSKRAMGSPVGGWEVGISRARKKLNPRVWVWSGQWGGVVC